MVMDMRFARVLLLEIFMGAMRVGERSMVVLVVVLGSQVLEVAHLRSVVRDVEVVMGVGERLVAVLLVFLLAGHLLLLSLRPFAYERDRARPILR